MADYSHLNPLVSPEEVNPWLRDLREPVAITGGTGFVGSHLVDALCAAGIAPRVLVRNPDAPRWIGDAPTQRVVGALDDVESLRRLVSGAGTVFHLAGVVRAGSEREFDIGNRQGTANLVAALREAADAARLVQVSSLSAAGPSREPGGLGPEAEPKPISDYGRSKLGAELEVRRGVGWWTIVRPPAIYGPRDTDVFEFFRMASRGVVALPAGERWLTVAWVGDVVRSAVAAAAGESGRLYHLGNPEPVRLDRLIESLCSVGGVRARIVHLPPALISGAGAMGSALQRLGWRRLALTLDKSREVLARHWTARTVESLRSLGMGETTLWEEGVARTWSWYRDRGWLKRHRA